jgi:hypothetical protein
MIRKENTTPFNVNINITMLISLANHDPDQVFVNGDINITLLISLANCNLIG